MTIRYKNLTESRAKKQKVENRRQKVRKLKGQSWRPNILTIGNAERGRCYNRENGKEEIICEII